MPKVLAFTISFALALACVYIAVFLAWAALAFAAAFLLLESEESC